MSTNDKLSSYESNVSREACLFFVVMKYKHTLEYIFHYNSPILNISFYLLIYIDFISGRTRFGKEAMAAEKAYRHPVSDNGVEKGK